MIKLNKILFWFSLLALIFGLYLLPTWSKWGLAANNIKLNNLISELFPIYCLPFLILAGFTLEREKWVSEKILFAIILSFYLSSTGFNYFFVENQSNEAVQFSMHSLNLLAFLYAFFFRKAIGNKEKMSVFVAAFIIFFTSILSGAISWVNQFAITAVAYGVVGFILTKKKNSDTTQNLSLLLVPFVTTYIVPVMIDQLVYVYPVALIGPVSSIFGCQMKKLMMYHRKDYVIIFSSVFILFLGYSQYAGYENWLQFAWNQSAYRNQEGFHFAALDQDSNLITHETMKGDWVLLDLWTTGCRNCIEAFPKVESLYQEVKDNQDFRLYVVYLPTIRDNPANVNAMKTRFIKERGLSFPLLDSTMPFEEVSKQLNFSSVPKYVIIDPEGTIRYCGNPSFEDRIWVHNIRKILKNFLAG